MIYIFGGGTVNHVRNHFALCAPAYGSTARSVYGMCSLILGNRQVALELTRMASPASQMETNADVAARLQQVLADPGTKAIVFNVALCDFEGQVGDVPSGKYADRLQSREGDLLMTLTPAAKLLLRVKAQRPDVLLAGFKTTAGQSRERQIELAARQIEETGADFVVANDTVTRENLFVEAAQDGVRAVAADRMGVLTVLADSICRQVSIRQEAN